jgi:hypothetical protein
LAQLRGDLTISVWVRRSQESRGLRSLVARQLDDGRLDHFFLGMDGDTVMFSSHLLKGILRYRFPDGAPAGWVHLAAVHSSAGRSKLFVNGTEVMARTTTQAPLGGGANRLIIGGAMNGPPGDAAEELFKGALDELVIYNRALPDAEIASLATGLQPSPSRAAGQSIAQPR